MNVTPAVAARADEPLTRRLLLLAVVVAAVAAIGIPAHATYGARVTADEPQYLLTALSLGRQFDLDISDEIADEQYRPFHAVDLDRQTAPLADGRELSPARSVVAVAARAADALRRMGRRQGVSRRARLGTRRAHRVVGGAPVRACEPPSRCRSSASSSARAPLATYASQVYPEIAAALAVTAAVAAMSGRGHARRNAAVLVVGVSALPWLSVKYVPVAATARAARLVSLSPSPFDALPASRSRSSAMAIVYVVVHRIALRRVDRVRERRLLRGAGREPVIGTSPNYVGRSRRLLGLFVDRGFGSAAWAPAWLLAPLAFAALLRRRRHAVGGSCCR